MNYQLSISDKTKHKKAHEKNKESIFRIRFALQKAGLDSCNNIREDRLSNGSLSQRNLRWSLSRDFTLQLARSYNAAGPTERAR